MDTDIKSYSDDEVQLSVTYTFQKVWPSRAREKKRDL